MGISGIISNWRTFKRQMLKNKVAFKKKGWVYVLQGELNKICFERDDLEVWL
jgi:hypothetical protein